ncbi:isocitrate lyase/phosphoenolpyruvate mutase family protein [Marimonas sp. MJW-29]|uniref:Isocitrate lyase/phosphoenolpyruvate mutase family protein n=1 Tax=Sulfitobacter sediminis TaxID=3234186 RepID=A0ABV3RM52_9RHOB
MDQVEKCQAFRALHVKGAPLVLWNIWDAGSAKAVAEAGARAVATGSWAVAAAQGFADGEALPMEDALRVAGQVVGAVDVPVSVDFEGGYAVSPEAVAENVGRLIGTGVAGLNFEDRVVGGDGLHGIAEQAARIAAVRGAAERMGAPLFINARTDVFFGGREGAHEDLMGEALERALAYGEAGADGLFVPGLADAGLIAGVCAGQDLPVNVMRMDMGVSVESLAAAGVARVSHGPAPYLAAMQALTEAAMV